MTLSDFSFFSSRIRTVVDTSASTISVNCRQHSNIFKSYSNARFTNAARAMISCSFCVALFLTFDTTLGFITNSNSAVSRNELCSNQYSAADGVATSSSKRAKVGDLLASLPTPSLLVEISLLERYLNEYGAGLSVDEFLENPKHAMETFQGNFDDCRAIFIHTTVTSTAKRDAVVSREGCGKSLSVCCVDTSVELVEPAGAYLGLGLANHHVGGYYWARSMGIGASLPAHGIYFGSPRDGPAEADAGQLPKDKQTEVGELFWKKRGPGDPSETTEE